MKDKNGFQVTVADWVRLIHIDSIVLKGLPSDEVIELQGMIGNVFKVMAMTDQYIQIEIFIEYSEGQVSVHELYLYNSKEFELIVATN